MFQNIFLDYSQQAATIEIFTMLLGAFLLGLVFGWIVKPKGEKIGDVSKISAAREQEVFDDVLKQDDLQLIEGIGPALEKLLHKYGVQSYKDMVEEDVTGLEEILKQAGPRYKAHNPATWPDQARLAMQQKWSELEEYQEILVSSRKK